MVRLKSDESLAVNRELALPRRKALGGNTQSQQTCFISITKSDFIKNVSKGNDNLESSGDNIEIQDYLSSLNVTSERLESSIQPLVATFL